MKIGIGVKLGAIAGLLICIAWFAFAKSMGYYEVKVYIYRNYVTLGLLIPGIFLTVFLTKKSQQGFLDFSQGLRAGVLYSLTIALFVMIFNYVFFKFITPDTIDYFMSEAKNSDFAKTLSATELSEFLIAERSTFSSWKLVPPILFFGLISSLIASAIFRRQNPAENFSKN